MKRNSDNKMKEGKGKFFDRKSTSGGKEYDSYFIYVPVKVAQDTSFPFQDGDEVLVKIDNGKVVIEKS